ncbi:unnamed protein product, partial [Vitis vinifera]
MGGGAMDKSQIHERENISSGIKYHRIRIYFALGSTPQLRLNFCCQPCKNRQKFSYGFLGPR